MSSNLRQSWNELLDSLRAEEPKTPNERAGVTDTELLGWSAALDERQYQPIPIRTREEVRRAIRRMNPVKFRQIESDMKWVKKKMVKLGLNPEDARYLF